MAVDIEGFLDRTGMKGVELQKKLDLSSGTLSIYKSGKSNPSYSILCRLIEEGMTAREMFGDELADILESNGQGTKPVQEPARTKPEGMTEAEFDNRMKASLKRLLQNFDIK